jgi:hypothetical protein
VSEHYPVILSRRSAAKDLKIRNPMAHAEVHRTLRSFAVFAAQDDGVVQATTDAHG